MRQIQWKRLWQQFYLTLGSLEKYPPISLHTKQIGRVYIYIYTGACVFLYFEKQSVSIFSLRLSNKNLYWAKNLLLIKNPQFWSDWAGIQATLPIHRLVILTKFCDSRAKIVEFLLIVSLWASIIFHYKNLSANFYFKNGQKQRF